MSGSNNPSEHSTKAVSSGPGPAEPGTDAADSSGARAGQDPAEPSLATFTTITTLLEAFIRHGLIGKSSSVGSGNPSDAARSMSNQAMGIQVDFVGLSSKLQELADRSDENSPPGRPSPKNQATAFGRVSQSIMQLQGYPLSTTITTSFNDLMNDAALTSLLTSKLAKADSVVLLRDALARTQANPNILITVFDQPGNEENGPTQHVKDVPSDKPRSVRFKVGPDDILSDPALSIANFGSAAALTTVATSLVDFETRVGRSVAPAPSGREGLTLGDVASRLEQLVILRADKDCAEVGTAAQQVGVIIQVGGMHGNPISQCSSTQMLDSLSVQQGRQSLTTSGTGTPTKSPPGGDAGDRMDHTATITPVELSTSTNASNTDLEYAAHMGSASVTSSARVGRNAPSRANTGHGRQQHHQQQVFVDHYLTSPQGSPPPSMSESIVSMYAPMQAVTPAPSLVLVNGANTGHRVYAWQQLQSQSGYFPPAATPAGSTVFLHQQPQARQQPPPGPGLLQHSQESSVNGSTLLYTSVPNGTPASSMIFPTPNAPMSTPMGSSVFTTPADFDNASLMSQESMVGVALSPFQGAARYSMSQASRQQTTGPPALSHTQAPANTPMQSMALLHDFISAAPPSTPVASFSHLSSPTSGRSSPRTNSKAYRAPSPSRVASHLRNQFGSVSSDDSTSEASPEPQNTPPSSHEPQRLKVAPSSMSMGSLCALGGGVSAPQNSMLSLDHVTGAPHNSFANLGTAAAVNSSAPLQNQFSQQLQQHQYMQQRMPSPGNASPTARSRSPSGRSRSLIGGIYGLGAPLASIGELSAAAAEPKAPATSRIGSMVFPSSAQQYHQPYLTNGGENGYVPLAPATSRVDNGALGGQDMGSVMMMPIPSAPPGSVAGSMYFGQSTPHLNLGQTHSSVVGSTIFPPEMLGSAPPNSRVGSMVFSPSAAGLGGPGGSHFGSTIFGTEQLGVAPPNSRAGSMIFLPHYQVRPSTGSQIRSGFLGPDGQTVAAPNSRMGSMMLGETGVQIRNHVQMAFKAEKAQSQSQSQPACTSEPASPKGGISCEAINTGRKSPSPPVNVMHFNSSNVSMEAMATASDNNGATTASEPGPSKKSPTTQLRLSPVSEEHHHWHRSDSRDDRENSEQDDAPEKHQHYIPVPQIVVNPGTPAVLSTTSFTSIPCLMHSLAPEHQIPSTSTVLLHRPPQNSLVNIAGHIHTDEYGRPISMEFAGNRSISHPTVMYPYPTAPPPSMTLHSVGDLQGSFNAGAMRPTHGSGSYSAVAQHIHSMTNGLSLQQQLEYERRIHEVNMHLIRVAAQRDAAQLALAYMQDQHAFTVMQHQSMGSMVPMGSMVHSMVGEQPHRPGYFQQHAVHQPHSGLYPQQPHSHDQDRHQHQHHHTGHSRKTTTGHSAPTGDRILERLEQAIGPHLNQETPHRSRSGSTSPESHSPPVAATPKTVQIVGGVKVTKVRRGSLELSAPAHASEVEEHGKGQSRPQGMAGM